MIGLKKYITLALCILLVVGLTGCGASDSGSSTLGKTGTSDSSNPNRDEEQPERESELYGRVKSIQGNLVVLTEMEQQQSGQDLSEEDKQKRREQMQNLSEEERRKLKESTEVVTGKTFTVTIPVGIPIKVKKGQGLDSTWEEGQLSDIYQGSFLTIWVEELDIENNKATTEYVKVSPNR